MELVLQSMISPVSMHTSVEECPMFGQHEYEKIRNTYTKGGTLYHGHSVTVVGCAL
jgi:hypothetical protein